MKIKSIVTASVLALGSFTAFAAPGPILFDTDGNAEFSNTPLTGVFHDVYTFMVPDLFDMTAGSVTSKMNGPKDVDFTSLVVSDGVSSFAFTQTSFDGSATGEQWSFGAVTLSGGKTYTLTVDGMTTGAAKYVGEMSVTAVPEPETYALMLAGLGALGFVAKRRQAR